MPDARPHPARLHLAQPRRRAPRAALGSAFGLALAAATGAPAFAQLLPQLGAPVQLGDLRRTFQRAYGPVDAPVGPRTWTITPGIGVEITATDNARALGFAGIGGGGGRGGAELVTTVTPSLLVQGATQRLQGSLNYAPSLRHFMRNPNQSSIGQNLSANGRATIFEDLLFLNASAAANEFSRAGGLGQPGTTVARQDRVQTHSFSVGPTLRHTFADYGTAELSHNYSFQQINGQTLRTPTPFAPAFTPGPTVTNTTQASFKSGQEFGRFNFGVTVQRVMYDGQGVLKGARRNSETLDLGYALTREITLLGQVGHQMVKYGGTRPISLDEPFGNGGVTWTPGPETSITVRYGYRDGGDSFSFEGSTAPTARIRLTAQYSEAMANQAEELQYGLGRTQLSASGIVIDPRTGMPVILVNNFAGAQGGLARVRRISVSGVLTQDIDVFTVSLNRDERIILSGDTPGAAPNTTYMTASLGWQRELAPGVRGNSTFTYSERSASSFGSQETITLTAGLTWALSETLSTRASYTYTRATSNQPGFSYAASLVALGLQKSF